MVICPECHSKDITNICKSCGFAVESKEKIRILLSKRDRNSDLFQTYSDNYDDISQDDLNNSIQDKVYSQIQNEKLFSYLGKVTGKNICDLGVGQGLLLKKILSNSPAHVTGIDISINYLRTLSSYNELDLFIANAENLPFEDEFDMLVCSDILEHVLNVGDFMVSINRAVKNNGSVIIKVPYKENLQQYARQRGCKYEFVHLRTFDKALLKLVLEEAGFRIDRFHYDGFVIERLRDWVKRFSGLHEYFLKKINLKYKTRSEISSISNFWGRLFMRPAEIVAVATKVKNI